MIRLAQICRHPIKAHGRETLPRVAVTPGAGLPFDREWAVAHEGARLRPGWNPCQNFTRGAKAPQLMAITAHLDEGARRVHLSHPARGDIALSPDDPADLPAFLAWVGPLIPAGRAAPAQIVSAGRAMTDSAFPSVAILNLASNRALAEQMGVDLDPHRWRGNLWLDGADPWAEWDWIGRELTIGTTRLRVVERITRCSATTANPDTGVVDADTLGALEAGYGHRDFGVYAVVLTAGEIAAGDAVQIA